MASIGSLQSAGLVAGLLNTADQNPEVAVKLLKTATQSDKNLVSALLPVNTAAPGHVDIRA